MKEYWIKVDEQTRLMSKACNIANAKADIIFCHGFMDHSGRYEAEAKFFNDQGFNFVSYDQRNHGLSDGKPKAFIKDFNLLTSDLDKVLSFFEMGSQRPFFLLGHSMGGLVATSYILNNPNKRMTPNGILLSAPLLLPKADMAPILQKLSGIVAFLMPKLKTIKLDPNEISSDKEQVNLYNEDPLIYHEGVPARSGAVLLRQMKSIGTQFGIIDLPLIIQHSQNDQLTEFQGSKKLFNEAGSKDKEFIILTDSKHEILKDVEHPQVLSKYADWMINHL